VKPYPSLRLARCIQEGPVGGGPQIPLYEIELRYPEREAVVLSEVPLEQGKTVQLAGRTWYVFDALPPDAEHDRTRFLCRLQDERLARR
jgi:hypothetical protein